MDRQTAAAQLVTARTHGRVLEVGSGPRGLAPLLVGTVARYDAIDRSASATRRLREWLAAAAPGGAWGVHTGDLADLAALPDAPPPADVVVAVNVNAVWTEPAGAPLAAAAAHLRPGGAVVLVLETPDPVDARVRPALHARLTAAGWTWDEHPDLGGPRRVALVAVPAGPRGATRAG
ncbi:methyltransferase domain-containing protein [Cellulomonas sp. NPDC057328]|uniref:methyltransferase domain-containing protein n=1 Tax=Cellulomonas sp. NPDC057328 TaxID=3346101 RepID=UPI003643AAEC